MTDDPASDEVSTDGRTIARRLAAVVDGDREYERIRVVDESFVLDGDPSLADLSTDGVLACAFEYADTRLAGVYAHPSRVRIEFTAAPDVAAAAGKRAGLRVRPTATRPPRTLVFVESQSQVDAALDVVAAVRDAAE